MAVDLIALVARLRAMGGDTTSVEVKSAAGGLPESLTSTLSALANLPGGGVIVLGLDEGRAFTPVGLTNAQVLKQGLGAKARMFEPPVRLTITDDSVDGQPVVVAEVHECDASAKPCRVASSGRSYLRSYDGDYQLSALEEQGFLSARTAPRFDRAPVPDSSPADLDPDLVVGWLRSVRGRSPHGLGRFNDDDETLRRGGVLTGDGLLTLAGLLTLGLHPQQFFPRFVVQVAAAGDRGARARNALSIDGPIPTMLDRTLAWVRANAGNNIVGDTSGAVRDVYDYPLEAVRELVANSLIHRDLSAWAEGQPVELRLRDDRLVISNPGGLYGISVDRLAREHVTSARNALLVALCQDVRVLSDGSRVIEALASGLPLVAHELSLAGLPPAQFIDTGIRFAVLLRRASADADGTARDQTDVPPSSAARSLPEGSHLQLVFGELMKGDALTVKDLAVRTGLPGPSVRRALTRLRAVYELVEQHGGRGRSTTYSARPS